MQCPALLIWGDEHRLWMWYFLSGADILKNISRLLHEHMWKQSLPVVVCGRRMPADFMLAKPTSLWHTVLDREHQEHLGRLCVGNVRHHFGNIHNSFSFWVAACYPRLKLPMANCTAEYSEGRT